MRRAAFTLVEVAIATMILVVACLVVLLLLPRALKAQQESRYHMLAALHAQNLIEGFFYHEVDLKGAVTQLNLQDNKGGSGFKDNWDTIAAPTDQAIVRLGTEQMRMLGPVGDFDIDNVVGNRIGGNYPVPVEIARRLESPGNEIRKILDNGGYIYYADPIHAGRLEAKIRKKGDAVNQRGDMQKLVWGVVGARQQNVLPYNPVAVPYSEIYPFPPQSRPKMVDRQYGGSIGVVWEEDGPPVTNVDQWGGVQLANPISVQRYRATVVSSGFKARDAVDSFSSYGYQRDEESHYQTNNWEWFAHTEAGSKWAAGVDLYRRLVNHHWLRIQHQLDYVPVSASSSKPSSTGQSVPGTREVVNVLTDANGDVLRDALGNPKTETKQVAAKVTIPMNGGVAIDASGGGAGAAGLDFNRGFPAPANGLGIGHLKGSDILEEDAAAHIHELANQIRISHPSLERRVMYRTAALALWAKVYRDIDIIGSGDPNIAGNISALADEDNPLQAGFQMPPIQDLHPTQILAASYLAHAAMMVTGYKPPFIDGRNTPQAADDVNLVPSDGIDPTGAKLGEAWEIHGEFGVPYEQLPYRAVEGSSRSYRDPLDELGNGDGSIRAVELMLADGSLKQFIIDASGRIELGGDVGNLHPDYFLIDGQLFDRDGVTEVTNPQIIDPANNTYFMNPYHEHVMQANPDAEQPVLDGAGNPVVDGAGNPVMESIYTYQVFADGDQPSTAQKHLYQVSTAGNQPIVYRRMAGGELNPFPPPYADRGAFNMQGERQYRIRWQVIREIVTEDGQRKPDYRLLRKVVSGDEDALDQDSGWAANAHRNALRLAMAWVSENPYDLTVPKPINRQTFVDRGIYQYDLFNAAGQARRSAGLDAKQRDQAYYPISFPVDDARLFTANFGPQGAFPVTIDSMRDWGEPEANKTKREHWALQQTISVRREGSLNEPFQFGIPYDIDETGWTSAAKKQDKGPKNPYRPQEQFMRWVNEFHGHGNTAENRYTAVDASRFHATRSFEAQDRTRQIVYWLVDWMQYEDAETAPSAPVDVSRLEHMGHKAVVDGWIKNNGGEIIWSDASVVSGQLPTNFEATVVPTGQVIKLKKTSWNSSKIYRNPPDAPEPTDFLNAYHDPKKLKDPVLRVEMYLPSDQAGNDARFLRGNPEQPFTWLDPERTVTRYSWDEDRVERSSTAKADGSGTYVGIAFLASGHTAIPVEPVMRYKNSSSGWGLIHNDAQTKIGEQHLDLQTFWSLGTFGADRDGDGTLDIGPIPKTSRMQATEIARINYYDPITWVSFGR